MAVPTSLDQGPPRGATRPSAAGSFYTAPAAAFLPYVVNTSQFPLPDTVLNGTGNISSPHLTETSYANQTFFEIVYTSTNGTGVSTVQYLSGKFNPATAGCILNRANCSGFVPNLPIIWGAPWTVAGVGGGRQALVTAIGACGSSVAIAASEAGQTQVFLAGDFGQAGNWLNLTPQPITGNNPSLVLSPSALFVTTNSSNGVVATTFHLPTSLPVSPPYHSGGAGPQIPIPFVTSVSPFYGSSSTTVTITGGNFVSGAVAYFGSNRAITTNFVSTSELTAQASGTASSSPVNVTVTESGVTSPNNPPYDWYTVNSVQPRPQVLSVQPSMGLPGTSTNLTGYGFETPISADFGTYGPAAVSLTNSTTGLATVPLGSGSGEITVESNSVWSIPSPSGTFSIQASQVTLPKAVAASPVLLGAGPSGSSIPIEGVLETSLSSGNVTFYNSTNGGTSFSAFNTGGRFSLSTGSPIFTSIGSTRLFVAGGTSGATASVGFGKTIFGLFTTNLQNRTLVETEGSSDGGHTWTGPYVSAPQIGTVASPFATISPEGFVYVTWLENGAGPWQVDQAVYSESGRPLSLPQPVPDSGGVMGASAFNPTVAVDGLARPLYLWGWYNATVGGYTLRTDGAYLSPSSALSDLWQAFNATVPTDYVGADFRGSGASAHLGRFQSNVTTLLGQMKTDLSRNLICTSEAKAVAGLMPDVTRVIPTPAFYGLSGHCGVSVVKTLSTELSNTSGPTAANSFLSIYADWLAESVGYAALKEPSWPGAPPEGPLLRNFTIPTSPLYPPDSAELATSASYYIEANPLTVNPNNVFFNLTGWINSTQTTAYSRVPCTNGATLATTQVFVPKYANESIMINNGSGGTFRPTGWMPSTFATGLYAGTSGWWTINITPRYQVTSWEHCGWVNESTPVKSWSTGGMIQLQGWYTTNLEALPTSPVVHVAGSATAGKERDFLAWNNSMEALARTGLAGGIGYHNSTSNSSYIVNENTKGFWVPVNQSYTVWVNLTSANGTTNKSWANQFNTALNSGITSHGQTWGSSCSFFEAYNPIQVYRNATNNSFTSGVTDSTVTLTWYSNEQGNGWVRYNDSDDGPYTQSAYMINLTGNPYHDAHAKAWNFSYVAQLHGLSPWAFYLVNMGVSTYTGCLEYDQSGAAYVQVQSLVALSETELPYDSITQQGGGAQITWSVPSAFAATASFDNGTLTYCNWSVAAKTCVTNSTITVPLPSLTAMVGSSAFTYYWVNSTFQVNLTALVVNTSFSAWVLLNYTLKGSLFVAESDPLTFLYAKDTSGDGLTDWEKLRGWEVTSQNATGVYQAPEWIAANPSLYATNGLVSDFQEKLFGLAPYTVDTAGSHLLDTWNLTFDLGLNSSNRQVPASPHLQVWNDLGFYDWTRSCQVFNLSGCAASYSFTPLAIDATNLTARPYPDSYSWASEILFQGFGTGSANQLATFMNLSGVQAASWLRATLGTSMVAGSLHRTLTIWGKLSWGANPLAASTPADGIADGYRVNALHDIAVDINVTRVSYVGGCPSPSSGTYAWALRFWLNYSTLNGPNLTRNYSTQTTYSVSTNCGSLSNYVLPMPINGTALNESLTVELILNKGTQASPSLKYVRVNGALKAVFENFSVLHGLSASLLCGGHTCKGSSTGGGNGYAAIFGNLTVIPAAVKGPTYMWLPTTNSTMNNLPWGLKRYTGEQDFDLVVVDAPAALTSDSIPNPQNSSRSYTIPLSAGLTSFLIPRGQFLQSPFGTALLMAANMTDESATAPLIGLPSESGLLRGYTGTNPLDSDICYWLNRTLNNNVTTQPIEHCSLTGTPLGGNTSIVVGGVPTAVGTNLGGLPSTPQAESPSEAGSALQLVVTLNVSSRAELDLLLAGLMDNQTGGMNGTVVPITSEVPLLGLNPNIVGGVANYTLTSSGLAGYPAGQGYSQPTPPPAWYDNVATGTALIAGFLAGGVVNDAIGFANYINVHQPRWLQGLEATFPARFLASLRSLGSTLLSAARTLWNSLATRVSSLLSAPVAELTRFLTVYSSAIAAEVNKGESDLANGKVPRPDALKFVQDFSGPGLWASFGVGTASQLALGLVTSVSLGAGFVVPILIGLIVSPATQSQASQHTPVSPSGVHPSLFMGVPTAAWAATNATNAASKGDANYTPNWLTLLDDFAWVATLASFSLGFQLMIGAFAMNQGPALAAASFAVGLVALIVALWSYSANSTTGVYTALAFGVLSLVLDVAGLRNGGTVGPIGALNILTAGMDTFTFAVSGLDLYFAK